MDTGGSPAHTAADSTATRSGWAPAPGAKRPHSDEVDMAVDGGCGAWATRPGTTRKRPYERDEEEEDREMDKMYKCNYWEDPAYAAKLRYYGLQLARAAAYENLFERADREYGAWVAARRQHAPAGAAATDPCSMQF